MTESAFACARNAVLAAGVFLPSFLLASVLWAALLGLAEIEEPISYHLAALAMFYLTLLGPVLMGSLVHSLVVLAAVPRTRARWRPALIVASALVVPGVLILLRLATGAYGSMSAWWTPPAHSFEQHSP
jgi:hypothetical protein